MTLVKKRYLDEILDEIWDLIESVSEEFLTYSGKVCLWLCKDDFIGHSGGKKKKRWEDNIKVVDIAGLGVSFYKTGQ